MLRTLVLATGLVALSLTARADESIAPETVDAVKKATVFIRVEGDGWGATGSGFVVSGDDKALYVATNNHVAAPSPGEVKSGGKAATITVVFDSGTKTERTYTATITGADPERDLAVLRVAGVKDPPKPIAATESPKLSETMQVYTFGFPFGKALAMNKGFPAITVGKASISSLRNGPDGELAAVQIDGNLNPGNSGGPVVDSKGRLVGVAVATIRDGQGIGLAVPSAELGLMMQGRVGRVRVVPQKGADGKVTARVEATLIDPLGKLGEGVTAHYLLVGPKAKRPEGDSIEKHPECKKLDLKAEKGVCVAVIPVAAAEGEVVVQVTVAAAGKPVAMRARGFSLALAPGAAELAGPPRAGWKEYTPRDKTFTMWVPERPEKQSDEERNMMLGEQRMRVNSVIGRTSDGLLYEGQTILLPLAFAKLNRKELQELVRGVAMKELKGKVIDSRDVEVGRLSGTEYTIEIGRLTARMRIYAVGSRAYVVQVTGTADEVATAEAETILGSFRSPDAGLVAKGPTDVAKVPSEVATPSPKGKDPTILGGAFDPIFKEVAPEGGLLIGFEVGTAPAFGFEMTRSVRPIYLVGGKESFGEQRGTQLKSVVTLKAKEGYAVGAISVMSGLGFDGLSVTFMKVTDGKLDPKDSYQSEYVGSGQKKPLVKIGGDGTPVVGIVGKTNARDLSGMGLLFKGQEGYEPPKKK